MLEISTRKMRCKQVHRDSYAVIAVTLVKWTLHGDLLRIVCTSVSSIASYNSYGWVSTFIHSYIARWHALITEYESCVTAKNCILFIKCNRTKLSRRVLYWKILRPSHSFWLNNMEYSSRKKSESKRKRSRFRAFIGTSLEATVSNNINIRAGFMLIACSFFVRPVLCVFVHQPMLDANLNALPTWIATVR